MKEMSSFAEYFFLPLQKQHSFGLGGAVYDVRTGMNVGIATKMTKSLCSVELF